MAVLANQFSYKFKEFQLKSTSAQNALYSSVFDVTLTIIIKKQTCI